MKGSTLITLLSYFNFLESSTIHVQKRYTQENVCQNTTSTLVKVPDCPKNATQLLWKSLEKKCHTYPPCNGEPLIFHCVAYKNSYAEVCAPKETITGHCCAEFDDGLGRMREDFWTECSDCPYQYYSNETSLYSECRKCKGSRSKRSVDHGGCEDHGNENENHLSEFNRSPVYGHVIAYSVTLLFAGICLLLVLYKYHKCVFEKRTTNSKQQNENVLDNFL